MAIDFKKGIQKRIILVQVLMCALILLLAAKSFEIQIIKGENLSILAKNEYSKYLLVKGNRGEILDRNGNKLATSIDALSVAGSPKQIKDAGAVSKKIAKILGLNARTLKKKLSRQRSFTWIKRRVSPTEADQIRKLKIAGIFFRDDAKRFYPNRDLAAQVLGFTGADDNGLEGLEYKYNAVLDGNSMKYKITKTGTGKILATEKKLKEKLKGDSTVLTIDRKIQYLAEQALKKTITENRAKAGMALVMRPRTGEILAMANYPKFNPNDFAGYDRDTFRNRATTDAYEPGSAMKVFTAAAAVDKGFFSPKSIFFCENGKYKIGRFTVHDTHPHGWLTLNQVIKFSSNIGAAKISESMGKKVLHDYLARFGFGRRTRVNISGETPGNLIPYRRWSKIDSGAIAFGQGISVSSLQLITAISAIANNGLLMKPLLVSKIISSEGKELEVFYPTPVRQVISPETARQVSRMMSSVVTEEGTGTKAAIDGYTVCGKTGTAQKALKNNQGYSKNKYISVFAGFAPLKNPELATLVVVDEPRKKHYGGDVAAPAFRTIMAEAFNYLSIPPEKTEPMIAKAATGETH
ncbi:MAG: penicillin-binding protein 2 [Desulfobacteraceae bacterium]|nr:penicillin-binding protein 2 [Desulfobacteraceae bacterium]